MESVLWMTSSLLAIRSDSLGPRIRSMHVYRTLNRQRGVVSRCASMTAELEAWRLRLTRTSSLSNITIEPPRPDVFGSYYDVYYDTWTAGVYNHSQTLAVLARELAVSRLLKEVDSASVALALVRRPQT
jgi:hypothetical protein